MNYIVSSFLLTVIFLNTGIAQPNLTIWRMFSDGHDAHTTAPDFYSCGSAYYFVAEKDGDVLSSTWSIKNEGTSQLTIELPLTFKTDYPQNFKITLQPDKSSLAPGEETHFEIEFTESATHGKSFLTVNSNDPSKNSCGLLIDGGTATNCICVCNAAGLIEELCPTAPGNRASFIPVFDGQCSSGGLVEGDPCQAISISDPCNCDNLVTISGVQYYRDTLTIMSTSTPNHFITALQSMSADTSFHFINGTAVTAADLPLDLGASIGGITKYPFLRLPETGVSIMIDGVPFRSAACPSISTCHAAPIPTLSQWSIMILSLLLMLFSIVTVRQQIFALNK